MDLSNGLATESPTACKTSAPLPRPYPMKTCAETSSATRDNRNQPSNSGGKYPTARYIRTCDRCFFVYGSGSFHALNSYLGVDHTFAIIVFWRQHYKINYVSHIANFFINQHYFRAKFVIKRNMLLLFDEKQCQPFKKTCLFWLPIFHKELPNDLRERTGGRV